MANKNMRYNPNSAEEEHLSHKKNRKLSKDELVPDVLNKDFNDKNNIRKPRDNT